jgi:ribokinase
VPGDRADGPVFDVLVVGSLNLDLVASAPRIPSPGETVLGHDFAQHAGGKGLNQAVAAARSGASTAMIGAVGDDEAGAWLRSIMDDDGIDHASVRTTPGVPTGRAVITVDDRGENSIVVVPGANRSVGPGGLPSSRVLLAQLEVPLDVVVDAVQLARSAGTTTVLNPAPATDLPDELLSACDVVVPNEHEVELLGGAAELLRRGATTVVVTRGAAGVDVLTAAGAEHHDAIAVDVVDTTGAGDAFCGALAARLAAGEPVTQAVQWAVGAGALATTRRGAVPSLPHRDEVEALLRGDA